MRSVLRIWIFLAVIVFSGDSLNAGDIHLAFWNVENLFDTQDDQDLVGDEDFLPTGDKEWSEERFTAKIAKPAAVDLWG